MSRTWGLIFAGLFCVDALAQAVEVAPMARVYLSPDAKFSVAVVELKNSDGKEFLLRIASPDHSFAERIVRHHCTMDFDHTACESTDLVTGSERIAFTGPGGWYSTGAYRVVAPDLPVNGDVELYFSGAASARVNPREILNQWLEQRAQQLR